MTLQGHTVMFQLDVLIIASEACHILRAHRSWSGKFRLFFVWMTAYPYGTVGTLSIYDPGIVNCLISKFAGFREVLGVYLHRKISGCPCAWLCVCENDRLHVQGVKSKGKSWKGCCVFNDHDMHGPRISDQVKVFHTRMLSVTVNLTGGSITTEFESILTAEYMEHENRPEKMLWWWGTRWTLFLKPSDSLPSAV